MDTEQLQPGLPRKACAQSQGRALTGNSTQTVMATAAAADKADKADKADN